MNYGSETGSEPDLKLRVADQDTLGGIINWTGDNETWLTASTTEDPWPSSFTVKVRAEDYGAYGNLTGTLVHDELPFPDPSTIQIPRDDNNNNEDARENFARAVKIDLQSSEARRKLGMVFHMLGKNDEAIVELKKAIELGNDDSGIRSLLGKAYYDKGEFKEALKHYKKAVEYNPHSTANSYIRLLKSKIKDEEEH